MGPRYLQDVLDTMGTYVDALKFAGGSFSLMPRDAVINLIEICHAHEVLVSTGGFIEYVLGQGPDAVDAYLREAKTLGFDVIELSCGFITIPLDDWLRLVGKVKRLGLTAKPEIGIQFGAGGASSESELGAEGTRDPEWLIHQGKRFLDAGADLLMIESESITERVDTWRTDVIARVATALGLERVMFEAADPAVFTWYVKTYGPEVNLFIDHSQIVQLECLRSGIWGTQSVWGRIKTFKTWRGEEDGMSSATASIQDFLRNAGVEFQMVPHWPAFTAQEEAAKAHVPGRDWAKVVICFADGQLIEAVLPAPLQVDLEQLRKLANAEEIRLAREHEFKSLFPHCEPGAMPPLGPLYHQAVFVDNRLAAEPEIVFDAGSHSEAIRMRYADFAAVVKPVLGAFSQGPLH